MKTLTQTIIVIVALNLLAAGIVPARNVSDEEIQAGELQIQQAELEQQSMAEVAAVLAQAQTSQPTAPVLPTTPSPVPAPTPPTLTAVQDNIYNLTRSLTLGSRTSSTGTVLVIPSEQTNTEDLLTINEDMSVMSRIIEKNIEQARIATVHSNFFGPRYDPFGMLLGGSRGEIQSMYLQGFGALFLLKVDFPLSPAPKAPEGEKETEKAEEGDPVWQQMRQQMYEPEKVLRTRRTDRPEERYDAEKVEILKTTLIKALKHAANIRSLKLDESVILTVTGSGDATGTTITSARVLPEKNQIIIVERNADGTPLAQRVVTGSALDDIRLSSPSILVIRAKKSDIDQFAKGALDFDQFRKLVQLLTCPYLGGAAERGGFFGPYYRSTSTSSDYRR
ncbi:MAG: hypothetical protein WBC05_24850 [Sedimentisphaerales bacterium]